MERMNAFTGFPDCSDPAKAIQGFVAPPSPMPPYQQCMLIQRKMLSCRIYFSCAVFTTIFIIITTGLFIYYTSRGPDAVIDLSVIHLEEEQKALPHRWRSDSLRKRGLFHTVLGAFGNLVFIDTVLVYQSFTAIEKCDVLLWGVLLGYYTWIFAMCAQTYRLQKLLRLNKLIVRYMSLTKSERLKRNDEPDYRWMVKHCSKKEFSNVCSAIVYIITVAIVIAACAIGQAIAFYKYGQRCYLKWGIYLCIGLAASFLLVVAPYIGWALRSEKDAHGIKRELLMEVSIGVPCFIIYIVWTFVFLPRSFITGTFTYLLFSSVNWIMFFVFICHLLSVVLPLVSTLNSRFFEKFSPILWGFWNSKVLLRKRNKANFHIKTRRIFGIVVNHRSLTVRYNLDMAPSSLEYVFNTPDLLKRLKQLAIEDFSVENVLFYEKYGQLCDLVKQCQCSPQNHHTSSVLSHTSTDTDTNIDTSFDITKEGAPEFESKSEHGLLINKPIEEYLWDIFMEFYQTYIRDGSPLQVNISYQARHQIDTIFKNLFLGGTRKQSRTTAWNRANSQDNQPQKEKKNSAGTLDDIYMDRGQASYGKAGCSSAAHRESTVNSLDPVILTPAESEGENKQTFTLGVFETARKEVFWNIFAGLYPRLVDNVNSD